MRRFTKNIALVAAILIAGCLTAGCGSTAKNAIAGFSPTRNASSAPQQSASSPAGPTPSLPLGPSATVPSASQPAATRSAAAPAPIAGSGSSPAPGSGSGSSLIWLWILLGAIVLVGVIVWIARARGHRSATAKRWRSQVIDAYAKGSALQDAMSVAQTPGARAAADAGARWSDIQRRADDLTQTLYTLREAAPDDEGRARVADALASLQAVRSAMDAERAPAGSSAQQAAVARDRLTAFEASLRALRASGQQET